MIHFELNYQELDPEAKFGLVPKKFTAVSALWTFFLGLIFTGVFYGCLYPLHIQHKYQMVDMFFHGGMENRSTIPYYTMFLTCWCLAFLFVKWRKLKVQRKALSINLTPVDSRFVITRQIASPLVNQLHKRVFQSEKFMLFWRIERTLNCLDNIGHVSDVSAMMNDLAENDENWVESSYTLTKGLIWATSWNPSSEETGASAYWQTWTSYLSAHTGMEERIRSWYCIKRGSSETTGYAAAK